MSSGVEFLCLFNLIDIVRYGIGRSSVSMTPWNVAAWSKYLIRSLLHPAHSVVISCFHCLRPLIEISAVSISWSHLSNSAAIHRHHQPPHFHPCLWLVLAAALCNRPSPHHCPILTALSATSNDQDHTSVWTPWEEFILLLPPRTITESLRIFSPQKTVDKL